MLVQQSKNTFIRTTENYGYITNQLTRHDRVYDESGAELLTFISRTPIELKNILEILSNRYKDIDSKIIEEDLIEFFQSLADDKFILMAESEEELRKRDESFSYAVDNPKTLASDFTQFTREKISENTQDFFLEEIQGKPIISNLQLELSSRCNERCIHCYIPNGKKNHGIDMPFERLKKLVDEFAEMGGISITLSGGEALLHKDIVKMLYYCREKDLKITVLSNLINLPLYLT